MCEFGEITELLGRIRFGDADATDRLAVVVYDRLRAIAYKLNGGLRDCDTMSPTALVHEGFLKLLKSEALGDAVDRKHFFALISRAMRQVLVDHARGKQTNKRAHNRVDSAIDQVINYCDKKQWNLLALDEALNTLEHRDPRKSQIVQLRFFGGFTMVEIAQVLDVSLTTVESDWRTARAFLRSQVSVDG
jgi:RNA polymerase sigma factor (TIGR02999 family)